MILASLTHIRADQSFVAVLSNGWPYHVTASDPLYSQAQAMHAASPAPPEPVPEPPTEAETLAAWRLTARKDRGPLCLALHAAGILSAASALEASKGNWPAEFAGFLDGMTESEQLAAQIAWADATVVRYQNTLLQDAALAYAEGDAAAATAILDSLFGAP